MLYEMYNSWANFQDVFSFVELEKDHIPCSSFQDGCLRRLINKCVAPCLLTKMLHLMTAFIQAEIMTRGIIDEDEVHEMMSNSIFFHNRLIERWMCDIDIDVVSQLFNSKKSENYAMECKKVCKKERVHFAQCCEVLWKID